MSKDNENKELTINQLAWIINYQPKIEQQHIHLGDKPADVKQEMNLDDEKRKRLMATNSVIRNQAQSGQQSVDLLKLFKFIDRYFACEIEYKYEWYALRRFLEKYNLLRDCNNEQFAEQMNNKEWFGTLGKCCEANEMNYYNYLNSVHPDKWIETIIQLGSRATKRSVSHIYKTYSNLELYKDQLIG